MMITTSAALIELTNKSLQATAVALDTEFVWERTFYPNLGLIQLAIGRDCYLIDPVAIEDLSPLGELLAAPNVIKILHDAQQDLTILRRATGANPVNIFDTRMASGFTGLPSTLSLMALLSETVQVDLAKTESRTDWIRRPLTDKQIEYARDDVFYLTEVMDEIIRRAKENGTLDWLQEEMKLFDNPEIYDEISPNLHYRKVKGSGRFRGKELAILQELAAWREIKAKKSNRPRGHVIHNDTLMDLTHKQPKSVEELKGIVRLSPKARERYGKTILSHISTAQEKPKEQWPVFHKPHLDRKQLKIESDLILNYIQGKASELNIDPALVASRKDLNSLLNREKPPTPDKHRILRGWRKEFMNELEGFQSN